MILNPFPTMYLSLFAYMFLRIIVGSVLIYLGVLHFSRRAELKDVLTLSWWPFGTFSTLALVAVEIVAGALFILGAYTQIAALLIILMSLELMFFNQEFRHETIPSVLFYILLFGISVCLFITGAGHLGFDLPI